MFKKSLVALALVTASTGAMAAADLKTGSEFNAVEFSIEGSASKAEILAGDVEVVLGAEYSIGDIVTITFAGGDLDVATAPTFYITNGVAAGSVTIGLLNSSSSMLTYRVTEVVSGGTTIGETLVIAGMEFDRDSVVAGGKVVASYTAETSTGVAIDSGTKTSGTIITASKQFGLTATNAIDFDEVIDVEANRLTFEAGDTLDGATIVPTNDAALTYPATGALVDIVLNGSFAFLDENSTTDGIQVTAGTITPAPLAADITASSITWRNQAVGATAITIETANSTAVIPTIDFTADVTVKYTDHGTAEANGTSTAAGSVVVASGADVGEWTLNGSLVNVPYVPFGPNTQPVLRHTNIGAQTGDISVRYMVEGEHTSFQDLGVIVSQATPGVRNLLGLVTDALKTEGYDAAASGFKVALEVTTNVPAADVTVFAAAKVNTTDSDRLTIGAFGSVVNP